MREGQRARAGRFRSAFRRRRRTMPPPPPSAVTRVLARARPLCDWYANLGDVTPRLSIRTGYASGTLVVVPRQRSPLLSVLDARSSGSSGHAPRREYARFRRHSFFRESRTREWAGVVGASMWILLSERACSRHRARYDHIRCRSNKQINPLSVHGTVKFWALIVTWMESCLTFLTCLTFFHFVSKAVLFSMWLCNKQLNMVC